MPVEEEGVSVPYGFELSVSCVMATDNCSVATACERRFSLLVVLEDFGADRRFRCPVDEMVADADCRRRLDGGGGVSSGSVHGGGDFGGRFWGSGLVLCFCALASDPVCGFHG